MSQKHATVNKPNGGYSGHKKKNDKAEIRTRKKPLQTLRISRCHEFRDSFCFM